MKVTRNRRGFEPSSGTQALAVVAVVLFFVAIVLRCHIDVQEILNAREVELQR